QPKLTWPGLDQCQLAARGVHRTAYLLFRRHGSRDKTPTAADKCRPSRESELRITLLLAFCAGFNAESIIGTVQVMYSGYKFNGLKVNASGVNESKEIHRFLSIPYAQPPTGNRRFAKPEALDFSRDVEIDASEQPPLCPQDNSTKSLPYSEDCLYMNIWSPDTTSGTKYPVLVYIHGGRFETGGIAEPEYQGETLVRNQNIVFVTINYRLGATGFLYLDSTLMPGNFGLLDQRLALKTITDMISAFGGDPNRITLAGHGTGSASVGFHIATQDVPVTRAVMMGGSHLMPLVWSNDIDAVRGVSERFANIQLNCARGEGKLQEVIECLRNDISIEKLIEEQKNYEKLYISLEFMPVLDKEFFNFMDPLITWGERRKNVTLLMGVTADSGIEFALNSLRTRNLTTDILNRDVYYEILRQQFVHYPRFPTELDDTGLKFLQLSHTEWNDAQNKELLLKKWSEALGDFSFLCPTLYALFDDDRPQPGEDMNAYLYYFGAPDPFRDNEAPGHVNDVRYFLGVPDGPGLPYPSEHNELAKRMMEDLANFVTTGRPNNNWRSVIAGDWNYNSYLPVQDPGLYDLTGGFAIRRCRWWYDTLSFVNRLVPGDSAKPMSPLRQDPFLLDGSTIGAAPARSKPQQEAAANNFQPTSAQIIDNATVELTEVGATVRGHRLSANANGKEIERFLGIPYAQPPTGDLRFAKPALKDIANATIDAQTMPKACPQAWNTTLEEDEDCLYLNIWTPRPSLTANESQQVPVLVYIHGGFFEVGGINDPYRSGEKIVELQDVVVVTIGYRLGVLGFLPFSAEGSRGNFGLFDQEMALKWVEANIHHFGGNASLITAVGDDAGAVSIGYHLIRNETRISRVILQTGSPSMAYPLNNDTDGTRMRIEQYLQLMGCNNSTTDAQLACMRAKSVSDINSVYTNEFANKFGPEALVTVDGDFLKEDPWHSVQQGDMSQVPMIVGFVDRPGNEIINRRIRFGELDLANISYDEVLQNIVNASYYNPRLPKELKQPGATLIGMQYRPPLLHRQVLIDSLSEAYSDRFYTCGNNEYLQQVISKRHPLDAFLYHYVFSEKSNVENITSDGASLSEDTFYLFGNPLQGPEWNDEQKSLSEKMIELFTHFAETGNPNPENSLDLWWEYTANLKPYLVLDAQVHNVSVNWGFRINDCGFWQEVLPYVNELKEPPEPTRPPIGPEGEIIDEIIIEIDLGRTQNRISIAGDVVRLANGKIIKRFLGLPYAEMPLTRWSYASFPKGGNYTAKSMPPACPQTINPVPERSMSEDCLYINVFFPNDTSTTYPTVVFLHGGNYTSGANSLPEYRGEQLLENEDVILITVNYRLGALGFLFLDDEKLPGNFGLMDQRLALDFIQRVIPFFGGSRTQITLMGHGTDAASAGFHAVTDSKDFFDRMILMGGSPSMPLAWSSSTQKVLEDSEHFVNVQLECARGPLDSVLECLRNLTLDKIMTEQLNMQHSRDHLVFLPVFNQSFFNYTHPYDAWSKGEMDKPNTATGIQFLKLALTEWNYYDYNKRIKAIWSRAMGDFNFLCPIWEATSDLLRAKQHDIHMYYIDVEDPLRVQEDLIGADHWGDIRYLFGEPLRKDLYPEVHKNLSRLMMHDFVQYIGGSAPSHWNATSQETSDFLLYDILQTDSGGPGNLVSVMVPDGFGLNTGRCPLWKNELPYVKSFVSAPFQEEETSKITVSASRKRPAIGKTSSVKDESEFNLYEVVSNYTVDVPGFGKVTGQTIMTLSNNITMSQFLGVRYAQPPVGNRRLAKPVKPHTTSDSKHLALTMPPMCIQREHHNRNMSEDCLYLNIWTPRRAGRNVNDIPVLVFIHGGFFEVGGISEDRWQGSMILDHYDAVVVTMNYRLGAFGFLSLDNKEVIGNYGLWDQEMALQWVADNIESFGGNKNRITLMGVEAGAVSIGYHMARPKQNRFHQVVLMTGSPYMSYPLSDDIEEVRDLQYSFLRRLRCPVDPAEALECIRSQPADSINEQQDVFQQLFQRLEFPPIIDGDFIRLDPWTMDPSTLMQVPMIFGGVDRPGNTFIERLVDTEILVPENFSHNAYLTILQSMNEFFPRYPKSMTVSGRTGLRNHFMQYNGQGNFERDLRDLGLALSDRYFTCANNKFLDAYSKASGKPVYNYLFTEGKEYKGDTELPLQHASLFEDAFYVFGNPSSPGPIVPDQQRRLSDAIMHAIVQFARTGRPSDLLKWDPYDSEKKSHLLLDADHLPPTMYPDGYRRQECGFWDHTLPFVNSLNDTAPPPTRPPIDGYPEVHKDLSRLMMDDFVQYIGGSAPARWNRTSFQNSDFLLYDVVLPDSGGAGNVISVMVGDGFGLNSGRCPVWKNELPYVNTLVPTTTASEEENFVKLLSSSGERPARTPNLQPQRATPFNVHEVIANYTIQVPDFGHVRGHTIRTISNVTMSHFLGIPFAQPPVGNLRLAKPDKPSTTSDTQHIAQQMPPACMQMQNYNFTMSEDCLYLNVWTPKREGRDVTNLPVLVFLHGGFFEVGSVGEDRWQGSMILDHQDAVVVTINYRLGVFGFLSLDNKEVVLMTGSPYMSYPLTNDTEEARELQNISRFLGVPYAEPPVGDLRFAPPRAIPNSPGKFIAQTLPHACPQDNRTLGVAYSEDCLYLNIWTPDAVQGRNYPVIVYLHGGNFESGSISQRELFGENLLSYEDVVLVTVAYRLGAFGFLYLSDSELPGNMGLLDQRLALNEVKRYISMFGGDPENIALAGHGIGAAAVGFHSITASKQNFKRAIMMGGSPTMPMAWYDSNGGKENTRELNLAFVSLALGCPSTTISEAITCLKTLDTKNIVDAQTPFLQLLLTLEFRPVLDSAFFNNRDPLEAWRHQEQGSSNTEMLMGFTTDTGGSYVEQALLLNRTFPYHPRFPRKLSETGTDFINLYFDDYIGSPDKQTLLNTWGQAVGDRYFLCPVWETIVQKGRNQTSTETYLYVFTARDPWDTDRMQLGSDHQADLRYFFGIPAGTGIAYPESHRNLSVRMMRDIVKFVKDGKPNPSWQTTKLGVWDYADYNNLYSDRYNATEGASTIQRCGVWYYDLPYVDGLVKSAKKSPEPLRRKSALSLPDVTTNEAPKSDSIIPRRTRTAIRNYNVSVSGYGTVVGSTVLTTDNNTISEFLGVRYAQPPLGDLRFKKPEPLRDAGDGVTHLALEMGLPCYQRNYYNFANMSEDCLTLNIWTPRTESNPSGTYPVIVFIHGGFFEVGSSAESRWNGENILDHEQAVIVTINYRLGAFGFLALNSSMASGITGNMGLFDQEAAISWVAKNIEAFGGDKNAITLAGAEAGSISVGYHLLREPTANKPFHRVIMMTGSPIQSYPLSDKPDFVKQYHAEFVRTLNCSSDVVNCLQSLSADVINEKQEDFNQIFTGI
uniref:COesterase domain-containing protein n=1 Tax=Macrostomum lignano TaxID=282301 RepID=A0A1I8G704_9PLAT